MLSERRDWLTLRISLPVLILSALFLAGGVSGAVYVQRLQKREALSLAGHVSGILAAEQLVIAIRETRTQVNQYLIGGDPESLERVRIASAEAQHWLQEVERLNSAAEERQLTAEIRRGMTAFNQEYSAALAISNNKPSDETLRRLVTETLTNDVLKSSQGLLDFNETQVAVSSAKNELLANRLSYGLLAIGGLGAIGGVLAGYGISRAIRRSIVQLSLPIRDVAGKLAAPPGRMTIAADPGFENLESVLQEISGRVSQVVQDLQRSQQETLRAEQLALVGQLAAGLAHELRNPLMSMKLLVQSALASDHSATLDHDDLAVLDAELSRLEELVGTFLDFARPPQPVKRTVLLQEIVDQTLALIERRARVRQVKVHRGGVNEPVSIQADPVQIRQVLLNLLLNSLEAVPNGGEVTVSIERDRGTQADLAIPSARQRRRYERVKLSIADNGHGIAAAVREQIFDPFVTTSETGLGLGLSICKRIVEAHEGRITAADRPGGGAVFSVVLPIDSVSV